MGRFLRRLRLWKLVDRLRDRWSPGDTAMFLAACLVVLHAEPWRSDAGPDNAGDGSTWEAFRAAHSADLFDAVMAATERTERIEGAALSDVVTEGLRRSPQADDALLGQVLDLLSAAASETSHAEILNEVIGQLIATDRSFAAFETPPDLAELMIRLGRPISGTLFDPAAGMGGLLQMAALYPDGPHPDKLIGCEANELAARLAEAQCFLYGMEPPHTGVTSIEWWDALREADVIVGGDADLGMVGIRADVVLLDPPINQRDWGHEDLYLNKDVWSFGLPSPRSADFAWVQLAVDCLKPDGRAIVVLPAGAASVGGRAERIRRNLVQGGCVEAVIFLPARFGRTSSVPLSVWILRRPIAERDADSNRVEDVLLVDATRLGERNSSDPLSSELDIDDIVTAVRSRSSSASNEPLAITVSASRIAQDGSLSFRHYQPLPTPPDLSVLDREVDELQKVLAKTAEQVTRSVTELFHVLREGS